MNKSVQRLPIHEDPFILEEVSERFEDKLNIIEVLSEQAESATETGDTFYQIRKEVHELFQISTTSNIPPIVEPLEILDKAFSHIDSYSPNLPWLLHACVTIIDRLHAMTQNAATQGSVSFQDIQNVQDAITPLAHVTDPEEIYDAAKTVVNMLLGDYVDNRSQGTGVDLFDDEPFIASKVEIPRPDLDRADFSLLRILSETMDQRMPTWKGRTDFIMSLALGMNALADNTIDIPQLEAAVYLHDFPMSRLPDEILHKKHLSNDEYEQIKQHPVHAYEIALTMPNMEEAATMVYQHHERLDGKGYPEGIGGNSICDGAKILAICDAFHTMTHVSAHKPKRRSILRAAIEINVNKGTQFDPFWVEKFNYAIRVQRLGGFI